MCESSAYILKDGKEELFLESVDLLENKDGDIVLINMFGEQKRIKAKIKALSLVEHKIILKPI